MARLLDGQVVEEQGRMDNVLDAYTEMQIKMGAIVVIREFEKLLQEVWEEQERDGLWSK